MLNIKYTILNHSFRRNKQFKPTQQIGFGKMRTQHLFLMDYKDEHWQNPRIIPYEDSTRPPLGVNFSLGSTVFHYGQSIFEGAKAFMHDDGELYTFRIDETTKRLNKSADLMIMPKIPEEDQKQAIQAILDVERLWCPVQENESMYIRPVMFGTSDALGVKPSEKYVFAVMLSPSGPYFSKGFEPIDILLTKEFKRVARGGVGQAKTAGNYAASLRPQRHAMQMGAQQVLYLSSDNKFLEEYGSMNHFHVDNRRIVIPSFTSSILESNTTKAIISLEDRLGIEVKQEFVPTKKFIEKLKNNTITEAGGLGTAAVIAPVGSYILDSKEKIVVGNGKVGPVSQKLFQLITDIQYGKVEAPLGWIEKVDHKL